jgi:hypothetical protein
MSCGRNFLTECLAGYRYPGNGLCVNSLRAICPAIAGMHQTANDVNCQRSWTKLLNNELIGSVNTLPL